MGNKRAKRDRSAAGAGPATGSVEAAGGRPPRDRYFWMLLGILVIAGAARLYAVETANFWLDELWTLELSCGHGTAHEHLPANVLLPAAPGLTSLADARPWWTIWTSLDEVTHPPAFFLLLRGWRALLGPTDMAARLLPFIASMASIGLLYHLVRRLNGPAAAVWAAVLMAVSGQQIYYAQEVRSYSTIVALGLVAAAVLIEVERRGPSVLRLAGFAALSLLLVMTHYFTVGLLLALSGYALIRLPRRAAAGILTAMLVAAVVFVLAWGPFFLRQRGAMGLENQGGAAFLLEKGSSHGWHTLLRLVSLPAQSLSPAEFMAPASVPPLVAWVAPPAFAAPLWFIRRRPDLLLWYLWVVGVVLPLAALDVARSSMHLAFPRYTLLAGPAIFAVIAAGFSRLRGAWPHVAPAAAVVACGVMLPASLGQPQAKDEWPQLVASAASEAMTPGDPLVVTAAPDRGTLVYLYVSHDLGPMNRPLLILTRPVSGKLAAELRAHAHTWVINAWFGPMPPLVPGASFQARGGPMFGELQWTPAPPPVRAGPPGL